MQGEQESCGPVCRFVYYMLDEQWDLAKAEFDRLLMSPDLQAFIDHFWKDGATGATDPEAVLGEAYPRILEGGFVGEDIQVLRLMIANPGCLQPLSDLLYSDGGEYWAALIPAPNAEMQATLERIRLSVMDKVTQSQTTPE